jgi:crotonobetainyl-CoA:carnitine CoA-transferase CaiB-like acyl-CoA transferase
MGANYLSTGEVPKRLGNSHPNIVPYQSFQTADGDIVMAVGNDGQFERFCEFAECTEMTTDPLFSTNGSRVKNREIIVPIIRDIIKRKPSKYWLEGLEARGVSCGPINRLDEVFADDQVIAREMHLKMDHPATGNRHIDLIASPIRMSETPTSYRYSPPVLGQHTDEILRDIGEFSENEIATLRSEGVI